MGRYARGGLGGLQEGGPADLALDVAGSLVLGDGQRERPEYSGRRRCDSRGIQTYDFELGLVLALSGFLLVALALLLRLGSLEDRQALDKTRNLGRVDGRGGRRR